MIYGALLMTIVAIVTGKEFVFDFSNKYVFSLVYLSIFGSVIAFNAYLTLVGRVGPGKAAYAILVIACDCIAHLHRVGRLSMVGLLGVWCRFDCGR